MAELPPVDVAERDYVPWAPHSTADEQARQQREAAAAAQREKDDTTWATGLGAAAATGTVGLADRLLQESNVQRDISFVGKAFQEKREQWIKDGISEAQLPLIEQAVSPAHADMLEGFARQNDQAAHDLSQFGVFGNIALGLADPGEFALGALSGGLGYSARAGRIANAVRSGLVNAAQGVATSAAESHFDPTIDTERLALSAASAFALGGTFGFRKGEQATMADAARTLAKDQPRSPSAGNDSFGAARVEGLPVSKVDGPIVDSTEREQGIIDEGAANAGIRVAFSGARRDLSAFFDKSKSAPVRNEMRKLIREGVGYTDRSIPVEESASEMQQRLDATINTSFRRAVEPEWAKYAQASGLRGETAKAEFMETVGRAMRDPSLDVNPAVKAVSTHVDATFSRLYDELRAAGVPGFENPRGLASYLPRLYSAKGFLDLLGERGLRYEDVVNKLVKPAMRSAWAKNLGEGETLDEDLLDVVANAWTKRGHDVATRSNRDTFGGTMEMQDVNDVAQLLKEHGVESDKADTLLERFRRQVQEKSLHSRAKGRIDMDESYSTTIKNDLGEDVEVSVADLLENNVDKLVSDYTREMTGWVALKNKVGVGTPGELKAYKDFLIQHGKTSGDTDYERAFDIVFNSILGRSTEDNPGGFWSRASRLIRNHAFLTSMGQVGYSMLAEVGPTVAAAGWRSSLKAVTGAKGIIRRMENGELSSHEARFLEDICAPGTDLMLHQPYLRTDDIGGSSWDRNTAVGRALNKVDGAQQYATRYLSIMSGMAPIQTYLQRIAGRASALHMIELANAGAISKSKVLRLRNYGLTEEMQGKVFGRLKGMKKIDDIAADWNNWSPEERTAFSAYMWRLTRHQVVEGDVGDSIQMMHSSVGKVFWQFRTFMTSSYTRHLLNGIHLRDWQTANMVITSTFFAGLGMAARNYVNTIGDPDMRKELLAPENLAKQAFQQASYSSVIPFMVDTMAYDMGLRKALGGEDRPVFAYGRSTGLDSGVKGIPALSTAQSLWGVLRTAEAAVNPDEDVTKKQVRDLFKLLWFQNMTGVRNAVSKLAEQFPDEPN